MSDNTDIGGYVPLFVASQECDYDAYLGVSRAMWNDPDMLNRRILQAKRAEDDYSAMADAASFKTSMTEYIDMAMHAQLVGDICARRLAILNDAARRGALDEVMA